MHVTSRNVWDHVSHSASRNGV